MVAVSCIDNDLLDRYGKLLSLQFRHQVSRSTQSRSKSIHIRWGQDGHQHEAILGWWIDQVHGST